MLKVDKRLRGSSEGFGASDLDCASERRSPQEDAGIGYEAGAWQAREPDRQDAGRNDARTALRLARAHLEICRRDVERADGELHMAMITVLAAEDELSRVAG